MQEAKYTQEFESGIFREEHHNKSKHAGLRLIRFIQMSLHSDESTSSE